MGPRQWQCCLAERVLIHLPLCATTFLARKSLPPNHLLPQNICLQLSPQPNTTAKEFTSRSWCGLERKVTWTQWIGDGNWWTTGSCQLWPVRLLPQKASCRWSTVTAQLPAEHNAAVAGHMDYQAFLLVDHLKLGIVRITIINLYWRKSVTTDGKSSEGHSAKKYIYKKKLNKRKLKKIEKDMYK